MLNDIQKWQITQLATNGGFSDRFIAAYVFGKLQSRVTEVEIRAITSYRLNKKQRTLLGHWRNGKTVIAVNHAKRATSGKQRRKQA